MYSSTCFTTVLLSAMLLGISDSDTQQEKAGIDSAAQKAIPVWPPKRRPTDMNPAWPVDSNIKIELEQKTGKLFVVVKAFEDLPEEQDANLYGYYRLMTVFYFSGDRFVGGFQQFTEMGSSLNKGSTSWLLIPNIPTGADSLVVTFKIVFMGRAQWPEKSYSRWYSSTYYHFSTRTLGRDGVEREITIEPFDCNFLGWLRASKLDFRPVGCKTVEFSNPAASDPQKHDIPKLNRE